MGNVQNMVDAAVLLLDLYFARRSGNKSNERTARRKLRNLGAVRIRVFLEKRKARCYIGGELVEWESKR